MIAYRGGEHFFSIILTDDKTVEMGLDVRGLEPEVEPALIGTLVLEFIDGRCRLGLRFVLRAVAETGEKHIAAELCADEFFELLADLVR